MFLDASAIVAILKAEPESHGFLVAVEMARGQVFCSPIARWEAVISLGVQIARADGADRLTPGAYAKGEELVEDLLHEVGARDIPITESIGQAACQVVLRYGKVAGHEANLNMGDCFAYTCAKANGLKLLYKGSDFQKTDMR